MANNYGQGNQTPRKYITIGSVWSDETPEGAWCAKGTITNQMEPWMAKLLLNSEVKVSVYPNQFKREDRHPDFQIVLSVPEDQLPQEYWDAQEQKQSGGGYQGGGQNRQRPQAPQGGGQRGGYQGASGGQRGGGNYPQRQAPQQRGGDQYQNEPYPPRQQSGGNGRGVPRRQPPASEYDDNDLTDPFAE
jgi:hypothetical protein